eukprot:522948_1
MGNVHCNSTKFSKHYKVNFKIGQGEFAKVYKCQRKTDKKEFAVKVVNKRNLSDTEGECLQNEVKILESIKHPNVIQMVAVFEGKRRVKMVLELCEHDLMYKMSQSKYGHLTEQKAAKITFTLAKTLHFLHKNGVVHRDLKPQNILFTKDGNVKLTDFGIAHFDNQYKSNIHCMRAPCGTPYYVAPEILLGSFYSFKIDYWSLGVILFFMLTGFQAFASPNLNILYHKILNGQYDVESIQDISNGAKDLIDDLLCVDPKKRIKCDELIQFDWIKKYNRHLNVSHIHIPIVLQRQQSLEKLIIDNYDSTVNINK